MKTKLNFKADDWYYIQGRGHVCVTKMPETFTNQLTGEYVNIDNQEYKVLGVETYAIANQTLYKGRLVGLLIEGEK